MKGTYCLIINIRRPIKIKIGALGKIKFEEGRYCYIGSGMNNLMKRISRHFSNDKKTYWHIDYLLKNKKVELEKAIFNGKKEECKIAEIISNIKKGVKNFGCSDCKCNSHLFLLNKVS